MTTTLLTVTWRGSGEAATRPPNPEFPDGVKVDISKRGQPSCSVDLPYPAPEVGAHVVECGLCGLKVGVTAAGRADDPRSLTIACKTLRA